MTVCSPEHHPQALGDTGVNIKARVGSSCHTNLRSTTKLFTVWLPIERQSVYEAEHKQRR